LPGKLMANVLGQPRKQAGSFTATGANVSLQVIRRVDMSHTIATMKNSTESERKNRKRKLKARIKEMVSRYDGSNHSMQFVMPCINSDIDELMQIARIEGVQQAMMETNHDN